METEETTYTEVPSLNYDCLEHLFQFVAPKDWPAFVQVCKLWKLAANIRFPKLTFVLMWYDLNEQRTERISFVEFKNILEFIAPQLRYANIQINGVRHGYALFRFGHFEYIIESSIGPREIDEVRNIISKRTKNIRTLKIDSFNGVTNEDWENFFRVNPVTTFKIIIRNATDESSFFETYISILPNSLERICIECGLFIDIFSRYIDFTDIFSDDIDVDFEPALLQFLDRLPRITKLKLEGGYVSTSNIARILSKHVSYMTDLCLIHCFSDSKDTSTILYLIPNCTNLTNLKLDFDFTLQDDLCTRITDNCKFIRRLTLLPVDDSLIRFGAKALSLKPFLSLPNLEMLRIQSIKITLTTEVKKLKKLFLDCIGAVDFDNLADALALMPCLTSLTLHGSVCQMSESAARRMKRTILSRGQNIALYTARNQYRAVKKFRCRFIKVAEFPCNTQPSKGEFAFFCVEGFVDGLMTLVYV